MVVDVYVLPAVVPFVGRTDAYPSCPALPAGRTPLQHLYALEDSPPEKFTFLVEYVRACMCMSMCMGPGAEAWRTGFVDVVVDTLVAQCKVQDRGALVAALAECDPIHLALPSK